jgi:hypothetical protein
MFQNINFIWPVRSMASIRVYLMEDILGYLSYHEMYIDVQLNIQTGLHKYQFQHVGILNISVPIRIAPNSAELNRDVGQ